MPVRRIVRSAHDLHTNIWETHNGAKHAPLPGIPARGSAATKVMARMSNDAASMGIHPSVICKLPGGERGCKLVLFASKYQFTVQVRVFRSCTTISTFAEPLDGPLHCRIPVFEDEDSERSWSRGLRAMLEFEGVAYYDSCTGHKSSSRARVAMASKRRRKKRRKGFSPHTRADAKPHRDFLLDSFHQEGSASTL